MAILGPTASEPHLCTEVNVPLVTFVECSSRPSTMALNTPELRRYQGESFLENTNLHLHVHHCFNLSEKQIEY